LLYLQLDVTAGVIKGVVKVTLSTVT